MLAHLLLVTLASALSGSTPAKPLRDLMPRRVPIGSCAQVELLRSNADKGLYGEVLSRDFNLVEPENDLKPPAIWKGIGRYDFTNPDFLLGSPGSRGWAQNHRMRVRGHVLLYARDEGYTIPGWLLQKEQEISSSQAKAILRRYISDVAGRYRGKIAMWDVVNEAIDDSPNSRPFNLRDSFWFRKLGPDFLVLAFLYAHEADPKAELYYNEYGVEGGGIKAQHMLEMAKYLRDRGAPITGIGLQYHTNLREQISPGDAHYRLLAQIGKLGLAFMVTELDVSINVVPKPRSDPLFGLVPQDETQLEQQAERYAALFRMALGAKNCRGIQLWGLTDGHSWIPSFSPGRGAALPYDAGYTPKPAYRRLVEVLKMEK